MPNPRTVLLRRAPTCRRAARLALLAVALTAAWLGAAHAAPPLRVGSVDDARFGSNWTLNGSAMDDTRAKLENPASFGPGGTVARSNAITDTAAAPGSIDAGLLANFDVFFIGWFPDGSANAFTGPELAALAAWVNAGGVLIVTCDDPGHDAVCESFKYPSSSGAENPMRPAGAGIGHPIFNGPFGAVPDFLMSGNQGFFANTADATVIAEDDGGQPTFLLKALGAGWLILFADVDIVAARLSAGAAVDPANNNDRVLGNLFAFAGNVAALKLGSVANTRFQQNWTLDGSQMQNTRDKLLNPANFGASGTFPRAVRITDTAAAPGAIDAALLSAFDVFFIGYLNDDSANAFTPGELAAMQDWVAAGGTLIVTCDESGYDAVCAHFGHPASTSAVDPMVPVGEGVAHPIFNGPFGAVPQFNMFGTHGFFTTTAGATLLAQDSSGSARPVFLIKQVGAGWVILFADVDIIANAASSGDGITSDNDRVLGNLFAFAGAPGLRVFASVLPISRSVQVGSQATAFATMLVTGLGLAVDCAIVPITALPGVGFGFQATNPFTNAPAGTLNEAVPASAGPGRTFFFGLGPAAPFGPADVQLAFKCANTAPAPVVSGLNTFLFLATAGPTPDMVALAATIGNTGIVDIPGPSGTGIFSVATVNLGSGADITVSGDTGGTPLPVTILVCRTDPVSGICLTPTQSSVDVFVAAGQTPTFAFFAVGNGVVAFDPANHRAFAWFRVGGVTVGATSVAIRPVP
jgi:hypothetical protein